MKRGETVYIMTNKRNGTLYTGVTSRLVERVYEHRTGTHERSFTAKYGCTMLVYYSSYTSIEEAVAEEKRIKAGNRNAKLALIEGINPQWKDLWEEIKIGKSAGRLLRLDGFTAFAMTRRCCHGGGKERTVSSLQTK